MLGSGINSAMVPPRPCLPRLFPWRFVPFPVVDETRVALNTLVIGYGNTLRGDDGVGYRLAEAVENWGLSQVEAYPCHQLTPDVAAQLAEQDRVIFVDAAQPQSPPSPLILARISPRSDSAPTFTGHYSHPADLLALTQQLYGRQPLAYTLLLPTTAMGYGETLSPLAETGLQQGLRWLRTWLEAPPDARHHPL